MCPHGREFDYIVNAKDCRATYNGRRVGVDDAGQLCGLTNVRVDHLLLVLNLRDVWTET